MAFQKNSNNLQTRLAVTSTKNTQLPLLYLTTKVMLHYMQKTKQQVQVYNCYTMGSQKVPGIPLQTENER
jgi:hypothetical protein